MEITIGDRKIGDGHPAFIIAELSANHNQDIELAKKTIRAMKDAGADAVKLQTYTADTMTLNAPQEHFIVTGKTAWDGQHLHALYEKAYMPWEWHDELKALANELGMMLLSTPFDKTAVDLLDKLGVDVYKVASFEITDIPLARYIASKGKPIIVSTGIAKEEDIKLFLDVCKEEGNEQIIVLKCTSGYPNPIDQCNILTMPDIAKKFDVVVGLSDHTMGSVVPITATALGAKVIEKHFILDRNLGGADSHFSMEPAEFKEMVDGVRDAEAALGQVTYELTERQVAQRRYGRSLFAGVDIKAGDTFTEENVRVVRPSVGLAPKNFEKVLGKKATQDLEFGTPLSWDHVEGGEQ